MNKDINEIQIQLNNFTQDFSSLVISSLTNKNLPYTSYAPYIKYNNEFYFIISKIAKHYENLSTQPIASIMFIEDESKASNIFFRKRLTYAISATLEIQDEAVKNEFVKEFGDMVNMLFKMDFLIVKCNLVNGLIVVGPGQAYDIDESQHIIGQVRNPKGHGKK